VLHEKGFVQRGKHPVVWCPKEHAPVSDHARSVGEGETPQEFTLLKFPLEHDPKTMLVAATLRPETVYGQTNLWVGKDIEYIKAHVKGSHGQETWIISEACAHKLEMQERAVEIIGKVKGSELLGKMARAPMVDRAIPVLPSHFCSPDKGTGIVTSVPSDAPDDWMGIVDLQQPGAAQKEGIAQEIVDAIVPVPIIKSGDLGDLAAVTICKELGIKTQHERQKLDEAKKVTYKKGFYEGVFIAGPYAGQPVQEAKEKIKKELTQSGKAEAFYELTGKVVCRCQTPSIVKIVSDQWFVTYGNGEWKKTAHEALNALTLYPAKARQQFDYVIDWLNDWACTREFGLGTRLPWDERWLIESLSDSTIYMAYYTLSHKIRHVDPKHLNRQFFDYVFLGKGTAPDIPGIDVHELRDEFSYWYPVDFRNSGKDLIQNHLTFFIFNHCAVFDEQYWPKGIGVNGWVTVNGQKMSKSLGNVIPVRQLVAEFGADATRITILNGGEGMDDPNWDSNFARSVIGKLENTLRMCREIAEDHSHHETPVDPWLRSTMNDLIKRITEAMELTNFRTALQLSYFEYNQMIKWYLARTKPNAKLMREALSNQLVMLAPFTPHICEEAWHALGHKGFISSAPWPEADESCIDPALDRAEEMVRVVGEDIQRALEKTPSPKTVSLFLAADWKREAYAAFDMQIGHTRNPHEIAKALNATALSRHGQELQRLILFLVKGGRTPQAIPAAIQEREWLEAAAAYLSTIAGGAEIEILDAGEKESPKAHNGLPGKPAVSLS
jgi:leucyl-tRNA synthetase